MNLVKIGGGRTINVAGIVQDLARMQEPAVLVHGANALRDEIARALGREKTILTSVSGYDSVYSDEEALDTILMAYAGLRNKRIVEMCHQCGINAVGLSGIDGRLVQGRRNRGIRVREGSKVKIVRDLSGKPRFINVHLLTLLLNGGYTPVLSIPILDEFNRAVNSENDDIVARLQVVVNASRVFQFIEAPGLLDDLHDPESLVAEMTREELDARESEASGRMKRKLRAIRTLLEAGGTEVMICDGRTAHPVEDALAGKGTVIR